MHRLRLALVLTSVVLSHALIYGSTRDSGTLARRIEAHWLQHPRELSALSATAVKAAHDAGTTPHNLLAILLVEGYFRPHWLQQVENVIWHIRAPSDSPSSGHHPDPSLGPAQLRVSTAVWIESLRLLSIDSAYRVDPRVIAERIQGSDDAIRIAALLLAVIDTAGIPPGDTEKVVSVDVAASRYRGGVTWRSPVTSPYGTLVARVATGRLVSTALLTE